jgi:hypothetical protein
LIGHWRSILEIDTDIVERGRERIHNGEVISMAFPSRSWRRTVRDRSMGSPVRVSAVIVDGHSRR